jgi:hypothetical protein
MNHCSCSIEAFSSTPSTGSALVTTRLSSVAMNIGTLAATTASHTGMRRTGRATAGGADRVSVSATTGSSQGNR